MPRPRPSAPSIVRSPTAVLVALAAAAAIAWGCSLPWREYRVSPSITGRLVRDLDPVAEGRVRLQVRSVDNATLGRHVEVELPEHGGFYFDPIALRVAGQEYGKKYVLLLFWIPGDAAGDEAGSQRAVTLWRADYTRGGLGGPIELACNLARPERRGPPCRFVGDAIDQPWLLSAGERDYKALCRSCHGEAGRGDGPGAALLTKPPPDLTKIAARRGGIFPYREIADWIDGRSEQARGRPGAHGNREMPVWGLVLSEQYVPGGFTEARVRNRIDILVEYLDSIQEP